MRPVVVQGMVAQIERSEYGQTDDGADGDHDRNLVQDGRRRQRTGQNLAGHHTRKGDDTHADHRVQRRQKSRFQGLVDEGQENLPGGSAEIEERLYLELFAFQAFPEGLQGQVQAGHGVAEDHAAQGDGVLGIEEVLPGDG